ncbi:hypothetical protein [Cysteiniphilum halobium]|uniref:hypothetical protein n=1 Tax=Cysteiniphilum halobium TaxID=2219059 RepID=UPI000E65C404|nr:hypothetical protein [Cysteiniphilum halobium]
MKKRVQLALQIISLLPVLSFSATSYHIKFINKTPYTLVNPGVWVNHGDGSKTSEKKDIPANQEYNYDIYALSGPGGDTRINGGIAYRINEFNNDHFLAGVKFEIDAHSDQNPKLSEDYTNGDDNLLHVESKFTNAYYLDVTVTLVAKFFPYKFISLGLGELDVTACGQHAARLAGGYYRNPCKSTGGVDNYLSIGFANSPDLCRITLDSGMQIKEGSLACNMGTAARYIKDKSAIVFVCQSKGFGTSACPWIHGYGDHFNSTAGLIY